MIRAGLGYDIHKFKKGRKLYLGGVEIPFAQGLAGHSDGDCLIHAIIDALLGALEEGDIGQLFPDTDPKFKGIRSTELLKEVVEKLKAKGMEIINIDSVVIAEEPRLSSTIPRMKKTLSSILGVERGRLSIKAKTNEGIGLIGKKRAIASWALVLMKMQSKSGEEMV
jgi:2-C-methyl-D-erythritol 2,4-cyclodiphosphate synthase